MTANMRVANFVSFVEDIFHLLKKRTCGQKRLLENKKA